MPGRPDPLEAAATKARRDAFLAAVIAPPARVELPELELVGPVADQVDTLEFPVAEVVAAWVRLPPDRPFGPTVRRALALLATTGRPPAEESGPEDLTAALVTLPLVARDWVNQRNLMTATYHLARLVDTSPVNHWVAVGVSLTAACFLQGQTDPIPELAAALRANAAPPSVLAAVQRVPVWARRREEATGDFEAALWAAYHLGDHARVDAALAARGPVVRQVARAMMAAKAAGRS